MKIFLDRTVSNQRVNVATRCPHCGHFGTFQDVSQGDVARVDSNNRPVHFLGIRKCPNEKCNGHLFFISDQSRNVILTSPSITIPFDKENIPLRVLDAFEESIKCHANSCFIASAIMIRKTLEEICHNQKAVGKNLSLRLKNLGSKILIPKELLDGMDDLRLLGNDAAHIEAQTYNEIGKEEIEVSLEFTKEILKAVYQYSNLLQKMKALKVKKIEPQKNV